MKKTNKAKSKRYVVTVTLAPQQARLLDAFVLVAQRAGSYVGPRLNRANLAWRCFTTGMRAEIDAMMKGKKWRAEYTALLNATHTDSDDDFAKRLEAAQRLPFPTSFEAKNLAPKAGS